MLYLFAPFHTLFQSNAAAFQHQVEAWLKVVPMFLEGTNSLIILDDCAASKDVKERTGELVKLGFSALRRSQRVCADPVALQHCEAFARERGGDRAVLNAVGEDDKGDLRKIRRRAVSRRTETADYKAERAQVLSLGALAAPPVLN